MRLPKILLAALTSTIAFSFAPAFAGTEAVTERVDIRIDPAASPKDQIRSIRAQAWEACAPEKGNAHPMARKAVHRDCQKRMVADVLAQLSQNDELQIAQKEVCEFDR